MKYKVFFMFCVFGFSVVMAGGLDFLLTPDPRDDLQVLSHVMNDFFKPSPKDVGKLLNAFPDPADVLAPALFLSSKSGKSVTSIIELRKKGLDWNVIFGKVGVPISAVFVDMDRRPGPPYGNAWGYWSKKGKHGRGKKGKHHKHVKLSDSEIVNWINLKVTSEYFHLDPSVVANQRAAGKSFEKIIGNHYRDKHKKTVNKKDKGKSGKKDSKGKSGKGKKKK